jgi:hypothetical protein
MMMPRPPPMRYHGLLRAKQWESSSEVRERTVSVRVREKIFRAFAVSKLILSWKDPTPARFEEILTARHAATMQYAMTQHAALMNENLESSDLGAKLEHAVHMALNEVMAILGFSLDPNDRAFAAILKAKTTILSSVLNAQVRVDERRFVKEDTEHDLEMEKLISERMRAAPWEEFVEALARIRSEFSWAPEIVFCTIQLQILQRRAKNGVTPRGRISSVASRNCKKELPNFLPFRANAKA